MIDVSYKFLCRLDLLFYLIHLKKDPWNEILNWDMEVENLNLNSFFHLCLWFPSGIVLLLGNKVYGLFSPH